MTIVAGARILVADDQPDVVRTLTDPLRRAGAFLTFVRDGEEALQRVAGGGYDLVLLDMKMPPHDWGGLWFLEQMQERNAVLPCIVLSGEGQQRQTVEAIRLGARDWISKSDADKELVTRCNSQLETDFSRSVSSMIAGGPGPLAHAYSRYQSTVGGDLQYVGALRLIEETIRLIALIGLATSAPEQCGPLRRVRPGDLARPSFGHWAALLGELASHDKTSEVFRALAQHLRPENDKQIQDLNKLRNNHAHGGHDPSMADRERVLRVVDTWAHRLASTPFMIGSDAQMRFKGEDFEVSVLEHRGALPPRLTRLTLPQPVVLKAGPHLFAAGTAPVPLDPWFRVLERGSNGAGCTLGSFDGTKSSNPKAPLGEDHLTFTDSATGERGIRLADSSASWASVSSWFRTPTDVRDSGPTDG
ncbi:response regulator [Mycolicibacterium mengxianglii]|uniref:response regulator n=1 Tax=Mycolicibacterium mengxianglii TaxID=2736649 RepID=UPI0018D15609|nr:response regulator [Mycolicibacterium mengxianglii]